MMELKRVFFIDRVFSLYEISIFFSHFTGDCLILGDYDVFADCGSYYSDGQPGAIN